MNKIILAATAAILVAGILPVQAAKVTCNDQYRDFWDRVTKDGAVKAMAGERLADISRQSLRAYDACQSGDEFSLHGLWDKIEKDKAGK